MCRITEASVTALPLFVFPGVVLGGSLPGLFRLFRCWCSPVVLAVSLPVLRSSLVCSCVGPVT